MPSSRYDNTPENSRNHAWPGASRSGVGHARNRLRLGVGPKPVPGQSQDFPPGAWPSRWRSARGPPTPDLWLDKRLVTLIPRLPPNGGPALWGVSASFRVNFLSWMRFRIRSGFCVANSCSFWTAQACASGLVSNVAVIVRMPSAPDLRPPVFSILENACHAVLCFRAIAVWQSITESGANCGAILGKNGEHQGHV